MRLLLYFLILIISIWPGCTESDKEVPGPEVVLRLDASEDNARNSEGDFITLKNGRIFYIYTHFLQEHTDSGAAYLASRFSEDEGETWSGKDEIVVSNEGELNVMSVSLLRLKSGRIFLYYLRKDSPEKLQPVALVSRYSDDETGSWSPPADCVSYGGSFIMNNARAIQLSSGRIILPVNISGNPAVIFSDDSGLNYVSGDFVPDAGVLLQEPGVVELNNRRLMMYCRTKEMTQYICYSSDMGETWTVPEPGNFSSPLSPASIKRIPATGDLLLVWNNNDKPWASDSWDPWSELERSPFNTALSGDEALSWDSVRTVYEDSDKWFCYTAIEFAGNYVLLGHTASGGEGSQRLANGIITRISIDWLYNK